MGAEKTLKGCFLHPQSVKKVLFSKSLSLSEALRTVGIRPEKFGIFMQNAKFRNLAESGLPRQCVHWLAMTVF